MNEVSNNLLEILKMFDKPMSTKVLNAEYRGRFGPVKNDNLRNAYKHLTRCEYAILECYKEGNYWFYKLIDIDEVKKANHEPGRGNKNREVAMEMLRTGKYNTNADLIILSNELNISVSSLFRYKQQIFGKLARGKRRIVEEKKKFMLRNKKNHFCEDMDPLLKMFLGITA